MNWKMLLVCGYWLSLALLSGPPASAADPQIDVVLGPNPDALEKFAATELADVLKRLHSADVRIVSEVGQGPHTVLIGNPTTNPSIKSAVGDRWPKLSDQGHLLKSIQHEGRSVLVAGGNTPQAILWSVYELAHQLGVRSLLQGDFLSVERRPLSLAEFDTVIEPKVRLRGWQTLDGGPTGWEYWGQKDHERILRQLAKLKFNRIVLAFGNGQPFLQAKSKSDVNASPALWSGRRFAVDGDTAGRKAFHGAKWFENPDVPAQVSLAGRAAALRKLVQGVTGTAHGLGMSVAIRLDVFGENAANEADLSDSQSRITDCLDQYPDVDALYLTLPQNSQVASTASQWEKLATQRRGSKAPLEINFVIRGGASGEQPPEGISAKAGVLTDAAAIGRARADKPANHHPSPIQVDIPLSQEAYSAVPQMSLGRLSDLVSHVQERKVDGWILHASVPSDVELGAYFLSKAAFDLNAELKGTTNELVTTIAGDGVFERLWKGFEMVEKATERVEESPDFAAPTEKVVVQHLESSEPAPKWWSEVRDLYTEAMNEMYRANTRAREGGRGFILYYARRYEFGLTYMTSLEAAKEAAVAKAQGDADKRVQQLDAAMENMYNALGAFSEVARDPSDRGVIAVLNEFGYRRLAAELQTAEDKK